jgi:hypothetical protein
MGIKTTGTIAMIAPAGLADKAKNNIDNIIEEINII